MLDVKAEAILAPGMVLCVETPYYELGWGGTMVEDTAIVTETGHELLTTSSGISCSFADDGQPYP